MTVVPPQVQQPSLIFYPEYIFKRLFAISLLIQAFLKKEKKYFAFVDGFMLSDKDFLTLTGNCAEENIYIKKDI